MKKTNIPIIIWDKAINMHCGILLETSSNRKYGLYRNNLNHWIVVELRLVCGNVYDAISQLSWSKYQTDAIQSASEKISIEVTA